MTHVKQDNTRKTMIGTPLLFILIFCFGFFLMHPAASGVARSTAVASESHKKTPATNASIEQLSPLPLSHTNLQPLEQAQPSSDEATLTASPQSGSRQGINPQSSATQRAVNTSTGITNPTPNNEDTIKYQLNSGGLIPTTLKLLNLR